MLGWKQYAWWQYTCSRKKCGAWKNTCHPWRTQLFQFLGGKKVAKGSSHSTYVPNKLKASVVAVPALCVPSTVYRPLAYSGDTKVIKSWRENVSVKHCAQINVLLQDCGQELRELLRDFWEKSKGINEDLRNINLATLCRMGQKFWNYETGKLNGWSWILGIGSSFGCKRRMCDLLFVEAMIWMGCDITWFLNRYNRFLWVALFKHLQKTTRDT